MSLKRLIAAAVVAGTLFAVAATDADGATARRPVSMRMTESISLNRAMVRPKLNLRMVFQFVAASSRGHAGWIEILSRGKHFPEVVITN